MTVENKNETFLFEKNGWKVYKLFSEYVAKKDDKIIQRKVLARLEAYIDNTGSK